MTAILFMISGSIGLWVTFTAPTMPLRTIGLVTAVFSTVGFWANIIGV